MRLIENVRLYDNLYFMKILIILLAVVLFSCNNNSKQKKIYEDSAIYYSTKWSELLDSGWSQNDSLAAMQKTRAFIYKTMRQHYIDKMNELK